MPPTQTPNETLLLKQPTLSTTHIGFLYAGDVWIADLNGEHPQRLTAQKGRKLNPLFLCEGRQAKNGRKRMSLTVRQFAHSVMISLAGAPKAANVPFVQETVGETWSAASASVFTEAV